MTVKQRRSPGTSVNRRHFLKGIAANAARLGLFGLLLRGGLACTTVEEAPGQRLRKTLRARLPGPDSVPQTNVADWDTDRAERALLSGISEQEQKTILGSEKSLIEHLERQQREDFETGRTTQINGWLLSDTEVAVMVLLAKHD